MILAVTGHRPNRLGKEYDLKGPYSNYIRRQLKEKINKHSASKIISGMALGVDMIFAELGISMGIPVIAAIPFKGQDRIWPEVSKERYAQALSDPLVECVVVSTGGYSGYKMQVRNEWICNQCNMLIAVWDGSAGGTANCVRYARSIKKDVEIVDPTLALD